MASPTDFRRMISWELSQITDHVITSKSSSKKSKKKAKRSENTSLTSNSDEEEIILPQAYYVTNSDNEEEIFYSANESLEESDVELHIDDIQPTIGLPECDTPTKKKVSKKKKKKKSRHMKLTRLDFFQPLCDMMDDINDVSIDTAGMDISNITMVPSLSELCLKIIKKIPLDRTEDELPFLITSLVSHDRWISGVVGRQVQCLEKLLGTIEQELINTEKKEIIRKSNVKPKVSEKKKEKPEEILSELKYLYNLGKCWNYEQTRPISVNDIELDEGYHCPLPAANNMSHLNISEYRYKGCLLPYLLLYANYLYPVTLGNNYGGSNIEPLRKFTISRVNNWINSRYSKISRIYSKFFKIWPAYVHWARGNLKLAADEFAAVLDSFEDLDKCVILNEMGRMFLHFGERRLAISSYIKSSNIELSLKDIQDNNNMEFYPEPPMIGVCYKALQAHVWDVGLMDGISAVEAGNGWRWCLKEISSIRNYRRNIWFLHVAAVESMMGIHAGHHVPQPDPLHQSNTKMKTSAVSQWLESCVDLLTRDNMYRHYPVLYYHLSLVQALSGAAATSFRSFESFLDEFASFYNWGEGNLPGKLFSPPGLPRQQQPHPWQNLLDLIGKAKRVPIIRLKWRVHLLHPSHPYVSSRQFMADNWIDDLNLRINSNGYLTGDMTLDVPPMREISIDPYTGSLHFQKVSTIQHYSYNVNMSYISSTNCVEASSWPKRLYESHSCVVELSLAYKRDQKDNSLYGNYMAVLDWYGNDGKSHYKLDMRKLIRKQYKQVVIEGLLRHSCHTYTPDDIKGLVNKLMELGLEVSYAYANIINPSRGVFDPSKDKLKKFWSLCPEFQLYLDTCKVFGRSTIMLMFNLNKKTPTAHPNVIAFINCESLESFMNPTIHCSFNGFSLKSLFFDGTVENKIYSHVKYVVVLKINKNLHNKCSAESTKENEYIVFDEYGTIVNSWDQTDRNNYTYMTCGDRLYYHVDNTSHCVKCLDIMRPKSKRHKSCLIPNVNEVSVIPGAVLASCPDGMLLLHPGTLGRLNVIGLRDTDGIDPPQDGFIYPQFTAIHSRVSLLAVFDVSMDQDYYDTPAVIIDDECDYVLPDDVNDYGSCRAAMSINDRLVIINFSNKSKDVAVEFDVSVSGRPIEFHIVHGLGYVVCATQFSDSFRSSLYLLSTEGELLGFFPCLGLPPLSIFSTFLSPKPSEDDVTAIAAPGGVHIFFHDGRGGICCFRPDDIIH